MKGELETLGISRSQRFCKVNKDKEIFYEGKE